MFYYTKSWVEFTSMDQYFGFFALKLMSLHKYKFYQKKPSLLKNYSTIWGYFSREERFESIMT